MKKLLLLMLCAFFFGCHGVPARAFPVNTVAVILIDDGLVTLVTHAQLMDMFPKLAEREQNQRIDDAGNKVPDGYNLHTRGCYDYVTDTCFVCVDDPIAAAREGLTETQYWTAVHEHAHQDDQHAHKEGASLRWARLHEFAPEHMTHKNINAMFSP